MEPDVTLKVGVSIPELIIPINDEDGSPVDLTSYSGRCQFRETPALPPVVSYSTTDASMTTGNGNVILAARTTGFATAGEYRADVFLTDGDGKVSFVSQVFILVENSYTK